MKARTRFAPSPTGYMHIGNLRTALYEYLIAKASGGDFVLRIEDTDQKRYVEGAVDIIYNTLKTVGMNWDEGPDKGGEYGPYVQSERLKIYQEYAHKLVELGGAHYCFCSKDEADEQKDEEANIKFKDPCLKLSLEEAKKRVADGESYVIRQTINKKGKATFHDVVYGDIEIDYDELDEGVLLKSDGFPTYNFANVVDDHLMKITHVVRGNEYISSTPKYNLIYEAFGWEPPVYVHVAQVMKDAQHKLSKRNGDASFQDLVAKGYLPEAILNYIALLGWNPGTEQEIFSLRELEQVFDEKRLNKSPAIFDIEKLKWMNGCYIRALDFEKFHHLAEKEYDTFLTRDVNRKALSKVLQPRIETLKDIAAQAAFIEELPVYNDELFVNKKMKTDVEIAKQALKLAYPALEALSEWRNESIFECLKTVAVQNGLKNGQVLFPVRIALTGLETTPGGASEVAEVLGKEETLRRLKLKVM
ncbi:MAG: glutamate--tRNA ligase [Alphaproteobacteria bacterium]|nr:glutamate--tRNA ligase [Alphaproteobacteria bacterium]MBP3688248.1 glutamate--tRNA ligase [Alphaproteobacteria bacterium]